MRNKEPNRNVYVGHRYVPKIMGEWDKTQDYEGLSIVTYEGNSYTSKKRVPVGIDILNDKFWVITGNYDAQVEYYRDETERVAEDLLLKADQTYVDNELDKTNKNVTDNKKVIDIHDKIKTSIEKFPLIPPETDDSPRINRAVKSIGEDGLLVFPPNTEYNIGSVPVVFTCHVDGLGAIFNVNGYGVEIGEVGTNKIVLEKTIRTPEILQSNKTWNGEDVGLTIHNTNTCDLKISNVKDFSTGILMTAKGTGNAYNEVSIIHAQNNKVNLKISPMSDGWVNENNFYGGRYSHESGEGVKVSGSRHILIESLGNHPPNNNVFLKPSIEGSVNEYSIECQGQYNLFIGSRFEGNNMEVLFKGVSGHSNTIFYGYNAQLLKVVEIENAQYNSIFSRGGISLNGTRANQGIFTGRNASSDSAPIFTGISTASNIHDLDLNEYTVNISSNNSLYKRKDDDFPRLRIAHQTGKIFTGVGLEDPKEFIGNGTLKFGTNGESTLDGYGADTRLRGGNLIFEGNWDKSHIVLGSKHIWTDSENNLRTKTGAPVSDTDGQIINLT